MISVGIRMLFTLISAVIFLISCGTDDKIKVEEHATFKRSDFKESVELKGESIVLDSLASPSRICVIPEKNLIIIADIKNEYLAKAYTLDSGRFIKYFIKKGEGPEEQLSLFHMQYDSISQVIYASDFYKKRIYVYSITSINDKAHSSVPVRNIKIREGVLNKPSVIGSGCIVDLRDNALEDSVSLLNKYDELGSFVDGMGSFPPVDKRYEKHQLWEVFMAGLSKSEAEDKLVVNYYYTDYLETYDTSGRLLKRIQGPDIIFPNFVTNSVSDNSSVTQPTKKQINAYTGIAKMRKNIYVLYDGQTILRKSYSVSELFCFSNDLVPLKSYKLSIPIFLFDIDWSTNTLYGLTSEREGCIIKYKL